MKKKDLLKQLNNLQAKIKPDQKWLKSNREILSAQIKAQTTAVKANQTVWAVIFDNQVLKAFVKPAASFAAVLLLILCSWIATVSATKNSLPGDFLYSLKLTTERVQVNLAMDNEKKTNLELEFAERRLDEVQKVSETDSDKNKKNVDVALKKFEENLNNVKSNLAKLEKTDTSTAVKVANILDEKAKVYVNMLMQHKVDEPQLADNTAQAITASKSTGDKALAVIVNELQQGQSDIKPEDVTSKVTAKIADSTKTINEQQTKIAEIEANIAKEAQAKADAAKAAEAAPTGNEQPAPVLTENSVPTNTNTVSTPVTSVPEETPADEIIPTEEEKPLTLEDIKVQPGLALNLLKEAEELLAKGEISAAYDKTKEADSIISLINKFIEINTQYLNPAPAPTEEPTPIIEPVEPANTNVTPTEGEETEPADSGSSGDFHI